MQRTLTTLASDAGRAMLEEENARLIAAAVNAVHRLAERLGRSPLEVAEGLDLVTMMRQRDEARREVERLRGLLAQAADRAAAR